MFQISNSASPGPGYLKTDYSVTTWTRPLGKELTYQNVTWEQTIAMFFLKWTSNIEEYKQ